MRTDWLRTVALCLGASAGTAHAQRAPCFDDVPVPNWLSADLGLTTPGASAPDAVAGSFRLCSDGAGYGAIDALRTVNQNVELDFALDAIVADLEEGALGGLEVRTVARDPDGPRMQVSVEQGAGGAWLTASVRLGDDEVEAPAVPVELPVHLRLRRDGGSMVAEWSPDGVDYFEHLGLDTAATALASKTLTVSAVQAAPGADEARVAQFSGVKLADFIPPPDPDCTEADVSTDGALISVTGRRLGQVINVRVAGERAAVLAQSDSRLRIQAPRPGAAIASGAVVLETSEGETIVGGRVSFAGRPFIRGDVNEDGAVDLKDARHIRRWLDGRRTWIACEAAADVDGDGDVDVDDDAQLRSFLKGRGDPPAAPFPAPGFSRTSTLACGLGKPPIATGVFGVDGEPLAAGDVLREGDVVELRGKRLPTGHEMSAYFGDVKMEQLPFSTRRSLLLRVGPVPSGGEKCPKLFESTDADANPFVRFGLLREVRPDTRARHLCPTFEQSRGVVGGAQWDPRSGELRVRIPRGSVEPEHGVQLDLILSRPAMTGGADRGSREVSVRARATDSAQSYDSMLRGLAAELTRALDGGLTGNGCGGECEYMAVPDFGGGQLLIRPCGDPPPDPSPPPPPPQNDTLAPYVPPLAGGGGSVQPIQPSCDDENMDPEGRLYSWCQYELATRVGQLGLPGWEASIPQRVLFDGPAAPIGLPAPKDRGVNDKRTMYSTGAWTEAIGGGYLNPCAGAARVAYCSTNGTHRTYMPKFTSQARVYKGFWREHRKLPASANPDDLYSYKPPNAQRQYLVGLHISSGSYSIPGYWEWSTFWFPRGNDTKTKDGSPLAEEYNGECSTGSFADMPLEVSGVWRNYVMCVNGEAGGTECGNPWGPFDECTQQSCIGCHFQILIPFPEADPPVQTGALTTAWMSSLTRGSATKTCYEEILAGIEVGEQPYFNLAPASCMD